MDMFAFYSFFVLKLQCSKLYFINYFLIISHVKRNQSSYRPWYDSFLEMRKETIILIDLLILTRIFRIVLNIL